MTTLLAMTCFLNDLTNKYVYLFERWEGLKKEIKMNAINRSSIFSFEPGMREKQMCANLNQFRKLESEKAGMG